MTGVLPADAAAVTAADAVLPSDTRTARWGSLPNRRTSPILTVRSGQTVTVDTISHEGILPDQDRDPVAFFARYGIERDDVLEDAIAFAAGAPPHDARISGPHVVTGPIEVQGALPGDLLRIDMLALTPRASYGIVSSRHGKGALPGELPAAPLISTLCRVRGDDGVIDGGAHDIVFPLHPFLGIVAVARDTDATVHSVPPGAHGGNLDLALLTVGSTLYLPVQVAGAMVAVGDPHYAQGDGEVALTAFEAPLRATLRLSVVPAAEAAERFGALTGPYAETPDLLVPIGLDADLDVAVQHATRAALALLTRRFGVPAQTAYAYLSAAADLSVTQVVDQVKGAHFRIPREHFAAWAGQ